ncbi:hypothetical protein [Asticcacaulis solisilvae]|uniref:hypothetical protein n=1 Tax=Asticcacaulis solisilvae TaxID=1217274 RepID=UPI003FD75573
MTVSLLMLAAAVALAVLRLASGGKPSAALATVGAIGLVAGCLGAVWDGLNAWLAAQSAHITDILVVLPEIVEVGYALLFGVLVWLVARIGNAGKRRAA